jgi:hypothetical protein
VPTRKDGEQQAILAREQADGIVKRRQEVETRSKVSQIDFFDPTRPAITAQRRGPHVAAHKCRLTSRPTVSVHGAVVS